MTSPDRHLEDAARWFGRGNADALPDAEQRALDAWLAADPAHRLAYADVAAAAYAVEQAAPANRRGARRVSRWAPWLAGAVAVPLLFLLVFVVPWQALTSDVYTTVGALETRRLPDDSILRLDTDSAVRLAYDVRERVVDLTRGTLDVEVTKDAVRPFHVFCGPVAVTAVGTRFSVARRHGAIEVGVTEGRVLVRTARDDVGIPLGAGERIRIDESTQRVDRLAADTEPPAWTRGVLRFADAPLADALAELDRYVPGRIVLLSERAATARVTAVLPLDDPSAAVTALAQAQGLEVRRVPGLLHVVDDP